MGYGLSEELPFGFHCGPLSRRALQTPKCRDSVVWTLRRGVFAPRVSCSPYMKKSVVQEAGFSHDVVLMRSAFRIATTFANTIRLCRAGVF